MGTQHVQTEKGVIFSAPWARVKHYDSYKAIKKRITGTIVLKKPKRNYFNLARGLWYTKFPNENQYLQDPHNMDLTSESFAQGDFFKPSKNGKSRKKEHFVVGAP